MGDIKDNDLQPYVSDEYRDEMIYKGAFKGADVPEAGYISGTHARISDRVRKRQLKDIGLSAREDHVDTDNDSNNIKKQRVKRNCFIFTAMFVLSLIVGALVSSFWGMSALMGVMIGGTVGTVLGILPMVVYLITSRRK